MRTEAMTVVRSGLKSRIDAIAAQQGHISQLRIAEEIDHIRHDARMHGLSSVENLASTLESALARGALGPALLSYLDLIRDAIECDDSSPEVCNAYLAALSLRIGN